MPTLDLSYTPAQIEIFFTGDSYKYLIIRKGRRFGFTKGAANAFIEYALEGITPMLWVDTINGNIERYFDRYFLPELKKLPKSKWVFNRQKKELKIYDSIIDFRSADAPESIEGFGYKKILLNEAGIILKNTYLYSNAILPMLLDYPDSQLIAAGVPKGKYLKSGEKHKFYELYESALNEKKGYRKLSYSSYDNPLISKEQIDLLKESMSETEVDQEIYGEFVEHLGENPFLHQYNALKHESLEPFYDAKKQLIIAIDFNLNPFSVSFSHVWKDSLGEHDHTFDEAEIANGSIGAMADLIKLKYKQSLPSCILTGDAMGKRGDISQRDNASLYLQLMRELGLRESQLKVSNNPTHENSRTDCNYYFYHHPDIKIHSTNCPNLIRDCKSVQCNAFGEILKKDRNNINQRADFIDGLRYKVHNVCYEWIESHQRSKR